MLEISICVLIAALSMVDILGTFQMWTTKTRINAQIGTASYDQLQAIEHFDLIGSFTSPPHWAAMNSADRKPAAFQEPPSHPHWPAEAYVIRDDGFVVTEDNKQNRPIAVEFSPQALGAEGYTLLWNCRSSNLPLALMREEDLSTGQDALSACRAPAP